MTTYLQSTELENGNFVQKPAPYVNDITGIGSYDMYDVKLVHKGALIL